MDRHLVTEALCHFDWRLVYGHHATGVRREAVSAVAWFLYNLDIIGEA